MLLVLQLYCVIKDILKLYIKIWNIKMLPQITQKEKLKTFHILALELFKKLF